jgi:hypothetical protein
MRVISLERSIVMVTASALLGISVVNEGSMVGRSGPHRHYSAFPSCTREALSAEADSIGVTRHFTRERDEALSAEADRNWLECEH